MIEKKKQKERAIEFREAGLSYSEILSRVPVAKSTLSVWLRSIGLSKPQVQRITEKRLAASLRGGRMRKEARIAEAQKILNNSKSQIGPLSQREVWLIGASLYWAEGSKEKEYHPGTGLKFTNSDPKMIKFFLFWLKNCLKIPKQEIYFQLYLHDMYKMKLEQILSFWEKETGFGRDHFNGVYFKRNKENTKRKNIGEGYLGVLRVAVKRSSKYTRMVAGWTQGIVQFIR